MLHYLFRRVRRFWIWLRWPTDRGLRNIENYMADGGGFTGFTVAVWECATCSREYGNEVAYCPACGPLPEKPRVRNSDGENPAF